NTSNLILAVASGSTAIPTNAASLSNKGIEAVVSAKPLMQPSGLQWEISANYARNSSSIGSLVGSAQTVAFGPNRWGVGLEARKGFPVAALVGNGFLRDKERRLILREGHPLPDTVAGRKVLGTTAPTWTGGLSNSLRFGWV